MGVCSNEAANDFQFIFEALCAYDLNWKPNVLLANASVAITAGFQNVFGQPTKRIFCFFHVLKNLEKYMKPLPKIVHKSLKADIRTLQLCNDETSFLKASNLFLEKWKAETDSLKLVLITSSHSGWWKKWLV